MVYCTASCRRLSHDVCHGLLRVDEPAATGVEEGGGGHGGHDDGTTVRWSVNPTGRGNVGRWINHSALHPNLKPRLIPGGPHGVDHPLIALYSCQHIAAGAELLWEYYHQERKPNTPQTLRFGKVCPGSSGLLMSEMVVGMATRRQYHMRYTVCMTDVWAGEGVGNEVRHLVSSDTENARTEDDDDHDDHDDDHYKMILPKQGRWDVPAWAWDAARTGFDLFAHGDALADVEYWEPVPLLMERGIGA